MTQGTDPSDAVREPPEPSPSSANVTGVEVPVIAIGPEEVATTPLDAHVPDDRSSDGEVPEYVQLVDDEELDGLLAPSRRDGPVTSILRKSVGVISQVPSAVWRALTRSLILDTYCVIVLWAITYLFFEPSLRELRIAYENDTRVFYYPIFAKLGEAWRSGHLQLWSTDILTGYPVFADGEAGVLYPFHLLALMFLSVDDAFVWLRPIRFFQGALFMFGFLRAIGTGRFGGLIGSITFAFSGFSVAQLHHVNIGTGSVWLPLALCFAEVAIRSTGRTRYTFAFLASVPFGLQGLIVHVQILLLSAFTFCAFVVYRVAVGPVGTGKEVESLLPTRFRLGAFRWSTFGKSSSTASRIGVVLTDLGRGVLRGLTSTAFFVVTRMSLAGLIIAIAGGIGAALSAVQLIPLFELGTYSFRGSGVDYSFATEYELPVTHFLSFLLPDAFMTTSWPDDARRYWGLWSRWEVFGYVGLVPLCLAPFGLLVGRSRLRWFFGAIVVLSLSLAVGEHAPFGAHKFLSSLPGFSALRAPGRFVFLATIGLAVLAAIGADALRTDWVTRAGSAALVRTQAWRAIPRALTSTILLGLAQLTAVIAPTALMFFSTYAIGHKDDAMAFLQRNFVVMRGFDTKLTIEHLYQFALTSLDIGQPAVARQLALLLGVVVVLTLWDRVRSLSYLWQGLLVVTLAADLIAVGQSFHPTQSLSALRDPGDLGRFVSTLPGMKSDGGALFRVYTQKNTRDEPNRLLLAGVSEANGYSSLEPDRHNRYIAAAWYAPNRLLDLMGVKYFVIRNGFLPLPSFNLTSFNTDRPLFSSTGQNGSGTQTIRFDGVTGDSIRMVSTLRWAAGVAQSQPVAKLSVVARNGSRQDFQVLAGVHTAEWDWERPELKGKVAHQLPSTDTFARTWKELDVRSRPAGQEFPAHLYYGEFALGSVQALDRIEVTFLHPTAQFELYGIAVFNDTTKDLEQAEIAKNTKFRKVYSDKEAVLYENSGVLPRSFLVPTAVVTEAGDETLQRMSQGDWAPERMALLELPNDERDDDGMSRQSDAVNSVPMHLRDAIRRLPPPARAGDAVPPVTFDIERRRSTSASGSVTISDIASETVNLTVDARTESVLVLNDLYYPGWEATLDGNPTQIYRANYLFRAVIVPQGQHVIEYTYRPRSFRLGLSITLGATSILVVGLILLTVPQIRKLWTERKPLESPTPPGSEGQPGH